MRFLSGLTKIMFLKTSGSPELMSESASALEGGSSVNDETRTAGTATIATPVRPITEILAHAARVGGEVHDGEPCHGDTNDRQPYGMHGHDGAAQESETNEIPLCSSFQERVGAREGKGKKEELGDQLVLRQALDELAPPRYARLAQVNQEEQ